MFEKVKSNAELMLKFGTQMLQKETKVAFSRRHSDPGNELLLFFKHFSDVKTRKTTLEHALKTRHPAYI